MKALINRFNTHPKYAKALHWGKLITITGSAQILIQGLGFLSGILIIRLLSTQEYAWYTLANTMLGTMIMLADSGISNGVMAEGGKVWQDKKKLGIVLATGLHLRRKFGLISLLITSPILAYLLLQHGASWLATSLIIISIIPAFFAALSDTLLEIVPKLHQAISPLQKNAVQVSIGRVVLNVALIFFFPFTFIAIIASSIPRLYANYKLILIAAEFANKDEKPDSLVKKAINKSVNRTLPIVLYYCVSGQISIWLISLFGTTTSISELGALGRLAVIFNLFATLFATLIVPRFSRMASSRNVLIRPFLLIQTTAFCISIALLFFIWLFSSQILWVLGKKYYGLDGELFLVTVTSCLGLMVGVCSQLVISRGWYFNPYLFIGINIASTILGILAFNIATLTGILYFNIATVAIHYLVVFIYGLSSIYKNNPTELSSV